MKALILAGILNPTSFDCLALNLYHEARNEPLSGQIAVVSVTMNRMKDKRFPNTICGVVTQAVRKNGVPVRHKCQFSWYCDNLSDKPKDKKTYSKIYKLVVKLLNENSYGTLKGATHYHNLTVNPRWSRILTRIRKINNHIFYKWEHYS